MWTLEDINNALERSEMAAEATFPIEKTRALLFMAKDLLEMKNALDDYKEKHGVSIHTYPEYVEIVHKFLDKI